jgi:hypothetical protein
MIVSLSSLQRSVAMFGAVFLTAALIVVSTPVAFA